MNIFETIFGLVPEAIYFSLFMIFTKQLKTKRLLFILVTILEYLLLKTIIHFNIYFQISYTILMFITLKVFYKEKSQITDIFTFSIASLILILISVITFVLLQQYTLTAAILNRVLMFVFIFVFKNKLPKIQLLYKKLWNRDDSKHHKIKSTTFRCLNIVFFNVMFYLINLGMLYTVFIRR